MNIYTINIYNPNQNIEMRIGNTVITKKAKANANSTKKNTYEIKNDAAPFLMKSIGDKASFEADDVLTLLDYLKRCHHATELYVALHLVHDLGRQMEALFTEGRGIACIGINDIVVITHRASDAFTHKDADTSTLGDSRLDPQFLFLNDRMIFEVDESDGSLLIDRALNKDETSFMSPELLETLKHKAKPPMHVHFKTAYYSVAQLVVYFLLDVKHIPDDDDDLEYMQPIKGTKLYWFLLRCLNHSPPERKYIYV